MSLSRGSIIRVTETPDVDNLGAALWLECHRHHPVGRLLMNRPQRQIEYRRTGQRLGRRPMCRFGAFMRFKGALAG
jgi:hypothetical protein